MTTIRRFGCGAANLNSAFLRCIWPLPLVRLIRKLCFLLILKLQLCVYMCVCDSACVCYVHVIVCFMYTYINIYIYVLQLWCSFCFLSVSLFLFSMFVVHCCHQYPQPYQSTHVCLHFSAAICLATSLSALLSLASQQTPDTSPASHLLQRLQCLHLPLLTPHTHIPFMIPPLQPIASLPLPPPSLQPMC